MSLHRRNPRRDHAELAIVQTLEARGFHVDRVSAPGFPDLVVTRKTRMHPGGDVCGAVWFVEIKRPKGARFTAKQIQWRSRWQGPPPITLSTIEQAMAFPEAFERPQSADAVAAPEDEPASPQFAQESSSVSSQEPPT